MADEHAQNSQLRIRQHNENAIKVANFLNAHPKVEKVIFPGLQSGIAKENGAIAT